MYKRQVQTPDALDDLREGWRGQRPRLSEHKDAFAEGHQGCLLYTSDAADERSSVDLGGRRIIKKKTQDSRCLRRAPISKMRAIERMTLDNPKL